MAVVTKVYLPSPSISSSQERRQSGSPFAGQPSELIKIEQRYAGLAWGEKNGAALVEDYDRNRRWTRTFLVDFSGGNFTKTIIFDGGTAPLGGFDKLFLTGGSFASVSETLSET